MQGVFLYSAHRAAGKVSPGDASHTAARWSCSRGTARERSSARRWKARPAACRWWCGRRAVPFRAFDRSRRQDAAVGVDQGGDAHVDGATDAAAALHRPESADRQMFVVFARAVEPAVVGDVEEEIDRRLAVAAGVGPRSVGVGVLIADGDAEGKATIPTYLEGKCVSPRPGSML